MKATITITLYDIEDDTEILSREYYLARYTQEEIEDEAYGELDAQTFSDNGYNEDEAYSEVEITYL